MIVQRCLKFALPICLVLSLRFGTIEAERWSRQVSNSEWIPLANPRAAPPQIQQNNPTGLLGSASAQVPQLPQLSLPPPLQQQYQDQLLQLQKTQESIQKLLLLQQQLKAQQQLLQSHGFVPSGFSNEEEDKQLHQGGLTNTQTLPDVASEDLMPPLPATEALPPVFPAQNFFHQQAKPRPPSKQGANLEQEFVGLSGQEFKDSQLLPHGQNHGNVGQIEGNLRHEAKHLTDTLPQSVSSQDEEEEVQLVYVPAETLAQRGQPKRGRGRKQYPLRQQQQQQHHQHHHQHRENQGVDPNVIAHDQDSFTRQLFHQIQMERQEKARYLDEERMKEIARLNEERLELERKSRVQQEALLREQELQRQREAEKQRKELERLEEMAKQRELERIREVKEKQELAELEQRRLAEIQAQEEKRRAEEAARQREAEKLAALEREKELELQRVLKQQQALERQREVEHAEKHQEVSAQALPLIKNQQQQFHRQHLTETSKPVKSKVRSRPRQRTRYQDQQNYRETTTATTPTTTPSPNQPPLAVYMGSTSSKISNVKVSDVLKILKDARTIAVLDTVGPDTPRVFVGPSNLDAPTGYAKFDLPYLSSIDHNRVERKVDKLPFFVAPLSFDPPLGYSKIPFPAPHIGSVVVNTLDNVDPKDHANPNPNPTPLIEPNSYLEGLNSESESTTSLYEPQTTIGYSQEHSSGTPRYEETYTSAPPTGYSGSRLRFKQHYDDSKPSSVITTSYYDDQRPATRKHKYYEDNTRTTETPLQNVKVDTSVSQHVSYSTTPRIEDESIGARDPSTRLQDMAAQLALINQDLAEQREAQRYSTTAPYNQYSSQSTTGLSYSYDREISTGDVNEVRGSVGPTQYSLPAELPSISPHLPGLVNALLDKDEAKVQTGTAAPVTTTMSTTTSTTSTTTPRTPTTTYRPRGRQRNRVVSTRPRTTTQTPSTRTNVDRSRRPYNRSRSRFTTTTEDYRESAHDATQSKIPETTLRYSVDQRRQRGGVKQRGRDKTSQQSEVLGHPQTVQQTYENLSHGDRTSSAMSNAFLQSTVTDSSFRQLDTSSNSPESYPSGTISTTENYPSVPVNHDSPLISEDYSRSQNYPQSPSQDSRYRDGYDQSTVEQVGGLETAPINGFNYQSQNRDIYEQGVVQRPRDYQLDGKAENTDFEVATTVSPRGNTHDEQRYSSVYEVNVPQNQPEYGLTGPSDFHRVESEKIRTDVGNPKEQPEFVLLPENMPEDHGISVSSTEAMITELTTETTTTSTTPVIIRQRLRGRVSTRPHHESSLQTRTRGSQDEYVRFNVAGQGSTRTSSGRQRIRSRTRTQNHGSPVQTDGNDYIKIHVAQQQRQVATTTPPPTTTTTTTARPPEEDVDYGFIRPPNFKPVHPVDNRFQAPVTFRPQLPEHLLQLPQQSLLPNDETAVESSPLQTQLLKTRQKYQSTPNRRLTGKLATVPSTTTTIEPITTTTTEMVASATLLPDDTIYATKPRSQPDDFKQSRLRGTRVRRPGRKRVTSTTTTTTTESVLDTHNELPLDENYPRTHPQPITTEQQQQRQNLFDDHYDGGSQFSPSRDPASHQFYETSSENYPSEFILNFGNYPSQPTHHEEYDQTQLASDPSRRYTHTADESKTHQIDSHSTTADVYGAESQWSTKLTRTSFQPSFAANGLPGGSRKDRNWFRESSEDTNAPDIITAAPEASSVTLVVSSDLQRKGETEDEESMLMGTTLFGVKTSTLDHTEEGVNTGGLTTDASTTITRNKGETASNKETRETWLMDRVESSTEERGDVIDLKKNQKNVETVATKKGARRRRVRVRVRPAVDDFVTAESQHLNSALNGIYRDRYKYDSVRESKYSASSSNSPEKSVLRDFESLRSNGPTTSTSTEIPEAAWTMSPAVTTPMIVPDDADATTTEEPITMLPTTTEKPGETTMREDLASQSTEPHDVTETSVTDEQAHSKQEDQKDNQRDESEQGTLNLGSIVDLINESNANNLNDETKQAVHDELSSFPVGWRSKIVNEMDSEGNTTQDTLSTNEESNNESDNEAHPKNHRAKWSEVRYPSALNRSRGSVWRYEPRTGGRSSDTSIPGLLTKREGDSSVKTLSDYVQAIFDTMKNADEETTTLANTERSMEESVTIVPTPFDQESQGSDQEESLGSGSEQEKTTTTTMMNVHDEWTTRSNLLDEEARTTRIVEANDEQTFQSVESTTSIDLMAATTLGTLENVTPTVDNVTSSLFDITSTDPPTTTVPPSRITASSVSNWTDSMLGKVLRTSTTTKVSHMTEICYRGRCVMTRPSRDIRHR